MLLHIILLTIIWKQPRIVKEPVARSSKQRNKGIFAGHNNIVLHAD